MNLLVIIITIVLKINLNYAFYDQFVLDRFGMQQFVLGLSDVNITKSCDSTNKTCIWKCCPTGQIMMRFKMCLPSNITFENITVYNEQFTPISATLDSVFEIVPGLMNEQIFAANSLWWYNANLIEDGRLFLHFPNVYNRWKEIKTNHFCVEMKLDGNELRPVFMAEYEIEYFRPPSAYKKWALIISNVCLFLTFIAYVFTPRLRNQNGIIFMIYLGCLIATVMTHCTLENYNNMNFRMSGILTLVFFHYFFKLCSFCWTNVIFYRLLRKDYKSKCLKKEIVKYCAYAIILPLFMTSILATIELSEMSDSPSFVTPQIQNKGNFSFNEKESLYYLYIPIMILLGFNWFVCYLKAVEFCKSAISKSTNAISLEQERNNGTTDLNKATHFVKLLTALTVFTLIDMLTVIYPNGTNDIAATFTMFLGLTIMIIFVYGQKIAQCCCMSKDS